MNKWAWWAFDMLSMETMRMSHVRMHFWDLFWDLSGNIRILSIDTKKPYFSIETKSHKFEWNCVRSENSDVNSLKSWFNWFQCAWTRLRFTLRMRLLTAQIEWYFPIFHCNFFLVCAVRPIWTRTYRPSNWSLQSAPFERRADLGKTTKKHFFFVYVLLCKEQFNLSLRECVRACVCFVYVFWHNTVWSPQIQMIKNFDNSYSTEQSSNACV